MRFFMANWIVYPIQTILGHCMTKKGSKHADKISGRSDYFYSNKSCSGYDLKV